MAIEEIDDKALFDSAISDAGPDVDTPQPEPTVEAGPNRDESGRFAAKLPDEPQPDAQPDAPQETVAAEPEKDGRNAHVPSWRLAEVAQERRDAIARAELAERSSHDLQGQMADLQRQLALLQKPAPQEPVDFFTDPNAALKQSLSPFEQRMEAMQSNLTLRASRAEAIAVHGRDAVSAMENAVGEAMRARHPDMALLATQMRQSDDPVGVAMQWHQREQLIRETGGDVSAYRQRIMDESLKDPAFLAKAIEAVKAQSGSPGSKPNTVVQLPPSINRQASAASAHESPGDLSDGSLYAFATSPR